MNSHYPSHSAYYISQSLTVRYHMHVMFQHCCAYTVQDTAQQRRPQTEHSAQLPKRYFSFVHGTVHHYRIRCVIHTALSYTLGRARLLFLKTPAMLMNAMIYKTVFDKVEAFSHSLARYHKHAQTL